MNRLDPNQLAAVLRVCEHDPDMVPVVVDGALYARNMEVETYQPPAADISVRDFVLGMEALGGSFLVMVRPEGLALSVTVLSGLAPPLWSQRASEIIAAFGFADRDLEVIDFLLARGDVPVRQGPPSKGIKRGRTMLPPVPRPVRLALAMAILGTATVIRVAGDLLTEGMAAVGHWIAPEIAGERQ